MGLLKLLGQQELQPSIATVLIEALLAVACQHHGEGIRVEISWGCRP